MDYTKVPFANPVGRDYIPGHCYHRLKVIKNFMGQDLHKRVLDIGERNIFAERLGIYEFTLPTDYNKEIASPGKDYDTVTCFEIIEHVMNPLYMMQRVYHFLRPGGVCYVMTPKISPILWFSTDRHFTEYERTRLETLFRYVGFEVVKYKTIQSRDWWTFFTGIRPMLRHIFQRSHLWQIRKPREDTF
jgi:SAM-dependent methyltransferase